MIENAKSVDVIKAMSKVVLDIHPTPVEIGWNIFNASESDE